MNATTNQLNIDFVPMGNNEVESAIAVTNFSNLVTKELRLCRISIHGSLEDRRQHLKAFLKVEVQMEHITQAISRGQEGKEAAQLLVSQSIPCAMHLENRAKNTRHLGMPKAVENAFREKMTPY